MASQEALRVREGGGTLDAMESRVSALETHMVYVRKDLDEIKESLKVLPTLATKADITYWKIQWTVMEDSVDGAFGRSLCHSGFEHHRRTGLAGNPGGATVATYDRARRARCRLHSYAAARCH